MLRLSFAALAAVVLTSTVAFPDNIQDAKELPQTSDLSLEADASDPQSRAERCSTCSQVASGNLALNIAEKLRSPPMEYPGTEARSMSSFEGCSTEKGCAGIKFKNGQVVEKYGDLASFKAAASANNAGEYTFHAGLSGNEVLSGGIPKAGPFWWMQENSPFGDGYNYQKSASSFSSSSKSSNGGGQASLDLSANPFLNGDLAKQVTGIVNGAQAPSFNGGGGLSAFGSQGKVDLSQNPFLNNKGGSSSFSSSSQYSTSSGGKLGGNKFGGSGYVGSSPSPFTASTSLNQIDNGQKTTEFDFEQQQNIDEIYTGSSGRIEQGELQQTCAGQGYVCVHKAQCNNGVVNTNGAGILQARTKKQYCNTKTEICCRIEIANIPGSGVDLQGTLGVGSATFGASGSSQGSSIFGSSANGASSANGGSFGASGSNNGASFGASGSGNGGSFGASGTSNGVSFGASSANGGSIGASGSNNGGFSASGSRNDASFGASASNGGAFGAPGSSNGGSFQGASFGASFGSSSSGSNNGATGSGSNFGASASGTNFGVGGSGTKFGASGSGSNFGASGSDSTFGAASGTGSKFGASGSGSNFGASGSESTFGASASGTKFGASGSGSNFGSTGSDSTFGAASGSGSKFGASGSGPNFGESGSDSTLGTASGSGTKFGASGSGSNFGSSGSDSSFTASGSESSFGAASGSGSKFGASSGSNFGASAAGSNFGSSASGSNSGPSGSQGAGNTRGGSFGSTTSFESSSTTFGSNTNQGRPNFGASGSQGATAQDSFAARAGNNQNTGSASQGGNNFRGTTFTSTQFTSSGNQDNTGFGATAGRGVQGGQGVKGGPGTFTRNGGTYNFKTTSTDNEGGLVVIPPSTGGGVTYKGSTGQTNFIETDSFSSGSNANGVFRPSATGPGIPYLPPDIDSSPNSVAPTAVLRPTTAAPGYLPPEINPQGNPSDNRPQFVPRPTTEQVDTEGSLLLDQNRNPNRPRLPQPIPGIVDIPAGCAAALKCTPIEYCTAEGVISNTTVRLTTDQENFRVPLTDCKNLATGTIGKCCRDSTYTDPWPTNQLGKWVPGVFGGDDGAYKPDSRGQPNNPAPVRIRPTQSPAVTGALIQDNFRTTTPRPNYPYPVQGKGQIISQGQGQIVRQGQGQIQSQGQGQFVTQGEGTLIRQGQGEIIRQGQGEIVTKGQGQFVSQREGQIVQQGQGQIVRQGQGQIVSQGQGQIVRQGQGEIVRTGQGSLINQGQGQIVTQGQGQILRQGQGQIVNQGFGQVENQFSESRVLLSQYSAGGQCGLQKGQKPYGNRNDLEVDFGEIPWQAMVLLQTNKSLLCGGVITRPEVVLTTASCVEGLLAQNVLIKGGEWKLGIDDEPLPFQVVQVKNILRHPGYRSGSLHNDVAILVLAENLRLSNNIYPICLPNPGDTLDAYYNGAGECITTGWGKQVLQVHIPGAIMHSVNISLINPGECQAKISQDYPHLLQQYDEQSCACGQPTNPISNVCKVDTGSALACTTGDGHWVLRGIYSWESNCQPGNQLAAFYKFDLEWYQWALGLIESQRFAQSSVGTSQSFSQQSQFGGVKGGFGGFGATKGGQFNSGVKGQGFSSKFSQSSSYTGSQQGFGQAPAIKYQQNPGVASGFSESYSEKQVFQSQPQIITYTTKPEIISYTTKPEYFSYTTKPKVITYTTKPRIVTYETSGTGLNPQFVAPGVTYNPTFQQLTHAQAHGEACQCVENGK